MRLISFEVDNLLGRAGTKGSTLFPDINIITGRNGAGKTSIIKLMWYVMSGNILLALTEVPFQRFRLVTSEYDITIHRTGRATCKIDMIRDGDRYAYEDVIDDDGDIIENAEDEPNNEVTQRGSSVLFPTFRRIEGGFTIGEGRAGSPSNNVFFSSSSNKKLSDIEEALSNLSRRLTHGKHVFVSSISTADITGLLLTRFADLSAEYSGLQQKTSEAVIERIKQYQADPNSSESANTILDEVAGKIVSSEATREKIMAPFDAVRLLVERLFRNYGIKFGTRINFGDAANAVNSDALSAGEKQILSFICYNAFYRDAVIFIDEPELSLHVDWQRQLFSILLAQQSSNQFVIATHSPFIYGKYPDREVPVDLDRGDSGDSL